MVKKLFILYWLFIFSIFVNSQTIDENIQRELSKIEYKGFNYSYDVVDTTIFFNDNWKFNLGYVPDTHLIDFDDSNWRVLSLPHDWSIEGRIDKNNPSGVRGGFYPMGKGCYRKKFKLPNEFIGKRIKIRFDGVYMNSNVYINGNFIGNRPYGFSSFTYDISNYLKFGNKDNILTVKVDNSLQPNCRWYTGSGINRNVYLEVSEQQHFAKNETFFRTVELDNNKAKIKIDAMVISNNYKNSERIKFQLWPNEVKYIYKDALVRIQLKDNQGKIVCLRDIDFKLRDYSSKKICEDLYVNNPILWSAENPYLYNLELSLIIDGIKISVDRRKVGIREIKFSSDNGMEVNGKKTIVKGVCLHKDAGSFGTAVPKEMWIYRLKLLKKMGCNAIRSHGPVDPLFIEVCDSLGFYFMAEAFDEWNNNWEYGFSENASGKVPYGYHNYFNQWAETDLIDMIKRDRNHPSVFIYSLGNEVPEQRFADGIDVLLKLKNIARKTDNTRPLTVCCDWSVWANKFNFMDSLDIAGYNYPDRYFNKLYEEQHMKYPDRIILGTENSINLNNWQAVKNNKFVVGMFLWVGIDYIGESVNWPRKNWEWGLIDLASTPKSFYYTWKAYWSDEPVVNISVHMRKAKSYKWRPYDMRSHWTFKKSDVDTVFVDTNQPEVELFLNGKSLGRKSVRTNEYRAVYRVDYEDGELIALAYNKGKIVAKHILRTSKGADKLAIVNKSLSYNIKDGDICFFNVEVQDSEGILYPLANNEVEIKVEYGELLALDSGDPYSHEVYKTNSRRVYEGKLFLAVRVKNCKDFRLSCFSDGLKTSEFKSSDFSSLN